MDTELADDIGQMLIAGFHGYEPDDNVRDLIEKYRVGTIILFSRNIKDPQQLRALTKSLQQIAKDAGHRQPLFISIDQENGIVTRIPGNTMPWLPGAMTLGASGNPKNAALPAATAAKYLRSYGIHSNYAPIADVNSNPSNPIIGIRSFGDDPYKVSEFVIEASKATFANKVLPCIKHFPGHGDTATDSHLGTAVVNKSMDEMRACELIPFARASEAGVESVMMSHIIVEAMGDKMPASISPAHYHYLRENLKYEGYIVTDCLEMKAISDTVGADKGAELALIAGADGIMISHVFEHQTGGFEYMYNAVKDGKVSRERVRNSVDKIRALKQSLVPSWNGVLNEPHSISNAELDSDKKQMAEIYDQCATVYRGAPEQYIIKTGEKVALVYVTMIDELFNKFGAVEFSSIFTIRPSYYDILKKVATNISVEHLQFTPDIPINEFDNVIESCDKIILLTLNAPKNETQLKLAHHVSKFGKPITVVATLSPYDFMADKWAEEFPVYIPLFEPSDAAFESVIRVLLGKTTPNGVAPISAPQ